MSVAPSTPHTPGHINCPACEEARAKMICSITPEMEFSAAARQWIEARSVKDFEGAITGRCIREHTEQSYQQYIRSLGLFFSGHKLNEIHLGHFLTYRNVRLTGAEPFVRYRRPQDAKCRIVDGVQIPAKGKTPCPVKPKKVNQELGLLKSILQRANCWTAQMEESYEPLLDDEEDIPRALTPEQQQIWLDTARSNPEWDVVYYYSLACFGTCLATNEIRGLRLGDINLFQRIVTVRRKNAKNKYRERTIELVGAEVLWAFERLIDRARELGAVEFHHFLFPWRVKVGEWDPTKPMSESGIKNPWNEVRVASNLAWFRQYDCRHTAITRLAESGVPIDVIMARAGHVSEKMRRHYTHISQSAQRRWMEHAYERMGPKSEPRMYPFQKKKQA